MRLPATRETLVRLRTGGHGNVACCHDIDTAHAMIVRNDWIGSITPSRDFKREWTLCVKAPTHRITSKGNIKKAH
jgi:hypothetical protein